MSELLPVIYTLKFRENFQSIPTKDQKRIEYDLTHMNRKDIQRMGYLKGNMNYIKKMNNGNYRIILGYCVECYPNFRDKLNCAICDGNNLERIIVFSLHPRKKVYNRQKFEKDLKNIRF